jgi:hypothetical protein
MFLCVVLGLNQCLNRQSVVVFYVGQVTPSIFVGESPLSTLWNVPDSYAASSYFVLVISYHSSSGVVLPASLPAGW